MFYCGPICSHCINMPRPFLFGIVLLLLFQQGISQDAAERRLEKKRGRLEGLQGGERIDYLNDIAQGMMFSSYTKWDSSLYYSQLAIEEAKEINYPQGLCRALIVHGDALLQFHRALEAETYFREAIQVGEDFKYEFLLTMAHRRLGQAFWYQGRFQDAINKISFSIPFFEKNHNDFHLINCYTSIASIYNDWGNYEKGFAFSQKALALSKLKGDNDNIIQCCVMIGSLYAGIGDHDAAFGYYTLASSYLKPCNDCYQKRSLEAMKGNLYRALGNYDSSMFFLLKAYRGNPTSTLTRFFIAETLLAQQRFDTSLLLLTDLYDHYKKTGDGARSWQLRTAIGAAYFGRKEYAKALQFTGEGLQLIQQRGLRGQYVLDALKLMSSVYKKKGNTDSALFYIEQYAQMKDSIISDQLKGKLFEFKRIAEDDRKLAQIELLKKQKQISEQQLFGGIAFIILVSVIILWYISSKRKNERLKSEKLQSQLQHKATELEMQALRAQMNPHFIFNCLSSINRFILKNETEVASDYLTRFSRLIRLVLVHSRSSVILLKDEIEMLKLYLDMEQLRFKNAFDYSISFSNSIDPETIYIPPLLLQPFCENSIWHGLMHKEEPGCLTITINSNEGQLTCVIEDNGIGRAKAAEYKSRSGELQKSLGLKITTERLALINKEKGLQTSYEIDDLQNERGEAEGTRVTLNIRYSEFAEEYV